MGQWDGKIPGHFDHAVVLGSTLISTVCQLDNNQVFNWENVEH